MVDDELIVVQRWFVRKDGLLCGSTVADVMVEFGFGVAERRPKDGSPRLFPPPDTRLVEGDEILVQGPFKDLQALKKSTLSRAS